MCVSGNSGEHIPKSRKDGGVCVGAEGGGGGVAATVALPGGGSAPAEMVKSSAAGPSLGSSGQSRWSFPLIIRPRLLLERGGLSLGTGGLMGPGLLWTLCFLAFIFPVIMSARQYLMTPL